MIRNVFFVIVVCASVAEPSALMANRSRRSIETCGVSKINLGLIVRGQDFMRGTFPWIVALMHTGTRPPSFFCGGTLISKAFVISAAHCILNKHASEKFLPRDILAIFGAHDLGNTYESGRIVQSPKMIFIHDDWNHLTESFDADVSLLEFWQNKIHFDDYIQPICLWDSENDPSVTTGVVAGWGKSEDTSKIHENKPKLITAPIQSNEQCFLETKALLDLSSLRTFCAGLRNGSGVCSGDSGGGLFIKVNNVYHLKGIVSSSLIKDESCDISRNAIYTNVLKFKDWIDKITSGGTFSSTHQALNTSTSHRLVAAQDLKEVYCTFRTEHSNCCGRTKTCRVSQPIETEEYVLASPVNTTVEQFYVSENDKVKYLPKDIGDKFPSLKEFWALSCGLTVLRDHYFKNMANLLNLNLFGNKITTIEPAAFKDLVSLEKLWLENNLIETLDGRTFATMVNLKQLDLHQNKIRILSPTTFQITGGKLERVDLGSNVCINKWYNMENWNDLIPDISANCA